MRFFLVVGDWRLESLNHTREQALALSRGCDLPVEVQSFDGDVRLIAHRGEVIDEWLVCPYADTEKYTRTTAAMATAQWLAMDTSTPCPIEYRRAYLHALAKQCDEALYCSRVFRSTDPDKAVRDALTDCGVQFEFIR